MRPHKKPRRESSKSQCPHTWEFEDSTNSTKHSDESIRIAAHSGRSAQEQWFASEKATQRVNCQSEPKTGADGVMRVIETQKGTLAMELQKEYLGKIA